MKLVIDEKLKHRLIGLAVIISLGAIFAPAMMKKSNQNMENNYSVRVKLPTKPAEPRVAIVDEKDVFKTIKIAKIKLPEVSSESQLPELAKAQPVHQEVAASLDAVVATGDNDDVMSTDRSNLAVHKAAETTAKHTLTQVAKYTPKQHPVTKPVVIAHQNRPAIKKIALVAKPKIQVPQAPVSARRASQKPRVHQEIYAVQLASFSRIANAQALVNKLHSKGYKANFVRVASRQGVTYKVYAGHSPQKTQAIRIKSQLASALQLNGFIVNTGVS